MSYKEWKEWLSDLPWHFRWFPLLVLLRPIIDNLYFLKNVSPLASPPYIAGVLTPLLCLLAVVRFRQPEMGALHRAFARWSAMLLLCTLLVLLADPASLLTVEFALKLSMPVYLFFFLRLMLRDLRDLHGLLQTILYSGIFVALVLLYELLVGPVRLEESRGLMRIQGSFGDVVSYGMYAVFCNVIAGYFYFSRQHVVARKTLVTVLATTGALGLLALINIHHTATYAVFAVAVVLFALYASRSRNKSATFVILLLAGVAFSIKGSALIDEKIAPLIETDIAVYSGEKDSDQLFHGRMGRWRKMMDVFWAESSVAQVVGLPASFKPVFSFIGIGSHNDFFRILFATGMAGLLFYLNVLWKLLASPLHMGTAQKYLVNGTCCTLLLYSISITPTFYAPFLYFLLPVMVYAGNSPSNRNLWKGHLY